MEDGKGMARLTALRALRTFRGRDGEFWLAYAEAVSQLFGAEGCALVRRDGATWITFSFWPLASGPQGIPSPEVLEGLAARAAAETVEYHYPGGAIDAVDSGYLLCFRIRSADSDGEMLALLRRPPKALPDLEADRLKHALAADIPLGWRLHSGRVNPLPGASSQADPLDILLCLDGQEGFVGAAMALCNELSACYGCLRVGLGWKDGGYVKLQAISDTERFERKTAVVKELESAMEECLDQDEEIIVPEPAGSGSVAREHRGFASRNGVAAMLSLPLRHEGKPVAVLSCERDHPFMPEEVRGLRIVCDQVSRRLADMRFYDRWFLAVTVDVLKRWGASIFGPDQTVGKMYAVAASVVLAVLLFGPMDYRVEAPFILRTHDLALLSAPFDGYIEKVSRKPGELVMTGQEILSLDTRQLLLEQHRSLADLQRYRQEEKRTMAENALAEMKVAEALKNQAESRADLIGFDLAHASIRAPFSGVLVEGDLQKLLGAPVKKGDVLLKVAKLEDLYVEMKVPERDIQECRIGQSGELSFITEPGIRFTVKVERIEPMAVTEEAGNSFLVIGRITNPRQAWWRPGMSGLAKLEAGRRTISWVLLHRTLDFLHMKLWW